MTVGSSSTPAWLAVNAYCWGARQSRLLSAAVAPLVRELHGEGLVRRAWFSRFDARGPHLFLLLGVNPGAEARVRGLAAARLEAWLAANPDAEPIPADERERRHAECRGKYLCSQDREPGMAPDGSVSVAEQEADEYPLWLFGGMAPAVEDEFWEAAIEVLLWAADQGGTPSAGPAVAWVAAVDAALRAAGAGPDAWRYHATTVLPPLAARLRDEEPAVLAALPNAVGERNRAALDAGWAGPVHPFAAEAAARLVRAVLAPDTRSPMERWRALREVTHCALLTMGQPVSAHVPLVLYAWQRGLPRAAPPLAGSPHGG
ncbi:lantibiotic dehydratase C-terminal domain-containing protein [Longimicrobium sp.]|jgi:hypothetical protein|uniref:lantibiotic dehydratase C-terminal domain-containing protein n=1 Tax=Longimicrobium sp. TaxID=2029185 RepID=UPI002ED783B9